MPPTWEIYSMIVLPHSLVRRVMRLVLLAPDVCHLIANARSSGTFFFSVTKAMFQILAAWLLGYQSEGTVEQGSHKHTGTCRKREK